MSRDEPDSPAVSLEKIAALIARQTELMEQYINACVEIELVKLNAQNVCPCVFRDGKFTSLCAMHQHLVDDAFKLGARNTI